MSTSGSKAETYAQTAETEVHVRPFTLSKAEEIATYFAEDLIRFVQESNINLASVLAIPEDYDASNENIIELLYDDLSRMLGEQLITGIHLLLSEPKLDPNTHAYPLRYHAIYLVEGLANMQRSLKADLKRVGDYLAPPREAAKDARFDLLIDWNTTASAQRRQVCRPDYYFDWKPKQDRFDATTLVNYRIGSLEYNSMTIVRRTEQRSPGFSV